MISQTAVTGRPNGGVKYSREHNPWEQNPQEQYLAKYWRLRPNMGYVKYMNSRGCLVLVYIRKTTIIIEMQVEQLGKATKKGGGPICPWQPSGHLQQKSLWNIVQTNHSFQNQWWQLQIQHKQVWCHHVIYLRKEPWQFDKRSVISGSCYILWNQMSVNFFTSSFVHMILRERSFVRLGRRCIQESR